MARKQRSKWRIPLNVITIMSTRGGVNGELSHMKLSHFPGTLDSPQRTQNGTSGIALRRNQGVVRFHSPNCLRSRYREQLARLVSLYPKSSDAEPNDGPEPDAALGA